MAMSPTSRRGSRRWPSFVAEERGCHQLKGVPEPVTLFRLIRASGGGRRSGVRQLTPLVGREEEMAMLMRRWERARQGDGQLVLIVGEPGVGKSRLIGEFHGRPRDTPRRVGIVVHRGDHPA
jgi:predicted ATP-dependent serine protease